MPGDLSYTGVSSTDDIRFGIGRWSSTAGLTSKHRTVPGTVDTSESFVDWAHRFLVANLAIDSHSSCRWKRSFAGDLLSLIFTKRLNGNTIDRNFRTVTFTNWKGIQPFPVKTNIACRPFNVELVVAYHKNGVEVFDIFATTNQNILSRLIQHNTSVRWLCRHRTGT